MTDRRDPNPTDRPSRAAGGIFVALGVVIGLVAGTLAGEPIIGLVAGTAVGLALLLLVYLVDRRRG